VGHSLGGTTAAAFVYRHPGMVRRLVLIAPLHDEVDISPLDVPGIGEYFSTTALIFFLEDEATKYFYKPGPFPGWKGIFAEQFKYKGFRRACLSALRNFISRDQLHLYREMGKLGKPTLLIWGKSDTIHPYPRGTARLKDILKAEVLAVDNASHAVHWEHPGIVNPPLIEFLSR
jgi:pimeloyl-ACP methyl ester carboxylesterase